MTTRYAPVLHALSVEPREARPGETVRVRFRTRNLAAAPSPPGVVRFILPEGLAVAACGSGDAGEGTVSVDVDAAAPGADVVAEILAGVAGPIDDGTPLGVQAAFEVDGTVLGSNVCDVVVRSSAVLDGPGSGVFVEAIDRETVHVRAVLTNEGDGAARDVRVVIPAPAGTVAFDREQDGSLQLVPGNLDIARIEPGERVQIAFGARIVEPAGIVRADGAFVELADGTRCALAARSEVTLEPDILRPEVTVATGRRRIDAGVTVRNDGWADAHDVRVRVILPAPMRLIDGSATVDDVPVSFAPARRKGRDATFARLERSDGALVAVVGRVAARCTARFSWTARLDPPQTSGVVRVAVLPSRERAERDGDDGRCEDVIVPFRIDPVRDVRVRIADAARVATAGERISLIAEVCNAGDVTETLSVRAAMLGGVVTDSGALTVLPGRIAAATLAVQVPNVHDTTRIPLTAMVSDGEGERAHAERAVVVRTAAASRPPAALVCIEQPPPVVRGAIAAPAEAVAGAPFPVTLLVYAETAVDSLVVRIPRVPGVAYVSGSTVLDGHALLDRAGLSPLHDDGLTLRDVPASTQLAVALTLLAPETGASQLELSAVLEADGMTLAIEPAPVTICPRAAFPVRPAGLPYHVDACALDVPAAQSTVVAQEAPPLNSTIADETLKPVSAVEHDDDERAFVLWFDERRSQEIGHAMRASESNALISHIVALRALLPDEGQFEESSSAARALDDVRNAARDVFDRLYVKLRIPGFDVAASDLEDAPLRRALVLLFHELGATETLPAFAEVPFGAPEAIRALVALVPARCDGHPLLGAALRLYACALDERLAPFAGMPLHVFEDALLRDAGFVLADARTAVADALAARPGLPGAA